MRRNKILHKLCVVAIAAQVLILNTGISLAQDTNLNRRLAEVSTSSDPQKSSTDAVNPQNIRFSRRYAYRYKFECTPDNQTELAIYKARRNRQREIVGSWEKAANRPLIQWTQTGSLEFGDKYSPKVRCQAVTDRFNQHFLKGEGKPYLPPLSEGILNGMAVVCAAKAGGCNSSNLLWTLNSNNRGTNGKILIHLVSSLKGNASNSLIIEQRDSENVKNQGDEWVENLAIIDDRLKAASVNQGKMLEVDMEELIEEVIEEQKKMENEK
ncbi:MAG: COP23 domain-containing protein [Trichodesmium sp.]